MGYYMPGLGYQENFLPFEQQVIGNEVHIITGDRYAPHPAYASVYEEQFGSRVVGVGKQLDRSVTIHRLPVPVELARRNNPWIGGLARRLNQIQPDIVHLHGVTPLSSLQAVLGKTAKRWTLVCDHHLCQFNLEPFTFLKRAYYTFFRLLFTAFGQKRVASWLPINEDARDVLATTLGIKGANVHINRLGVDTNMFYFNQSIREGYRRKNNIPPDLRLIVFAGKIEPRKRLEDLLTAFASAFPGKNQDKAMLAIYGGGEKSQLEALKTRAEELEIENAVRFHPMQPHDQLPKIFNAADIGVWPGDAAITAIEALSCGLQVILPSDPGLSYVASCKGATEFPRGDTGALADLIVLQAGPSMSARNQIAADCAEKLSWTAIAHDSIEIYRHSLATTKSENAK
ncbi:MAG: glycosyltransferase [Alphaproteobacteria bacterium]|nr:glycosyltransferase [Alphaproteobacteria bacterium]